MDARVLLIGVGGGVIVTITLHYPCYIYLPGLFIDNWHPANAWIAWALLIIAALELFLIGFLAGKISRSHAPIQGGIAGYLASLLAYSAIVGPAAGVYGAQNILLHGLRPAESDLIFLTLIRDAVVSVIWWSYICLWISIAAGCLLGALGGWVGKAPKCMSSPIEFPLKPAIWFLLFEAWDYPFTVFTFSLLDTQIYKASEAIHLPSPYPAWTAANFPILTAYLWMLFWQLVLWRLIHRAKVQAMRVPGIISAGIISLIIPAILLFLLLVIHGGWTYTALQIGPLLVGQASFRDAMKVRHLPKIKSERPISLKAYLNTALLIGVFLLVVTYMPGFTIPAYSLVTLVVSAISSLAHTSSTVANIVTTVEVHYIMIQSLVVVGTFSALWNTLAIVLTYRNLTLFVRRYGKTVLARVPPKVGKGTDSSG